MVFQITVLNCTAGQTLCDFHAERYQLTLYRKIECDVKPKLTIQVHTLYGPIDSTAHNIHVKITHHSPFFFFLI